MYQLSLTNTNRTLHHNCKVGMTLQFRVSDTEQDKEMEELQKKERKKDTSQENTRTNEKWFTKEEEMLLYTGNTVKYVGMILDTKNFVGRLM